MAKNSMRMIASLLVTAAVCVTPAEAVRAALADVQALEPRYRQQMRWVVVGGDEQEIAVRYTVNAISRARTIHKPERVELSHKRVVELDNDAPSNVSGVNPDVPDRSNLRLRFSPVLLRIDLAALASARDPRTYHDLVAAWESIAFDDPYFGLKSQVVVPGTKGVKTVRVDGGWLNLSEAAALRAATGSAAPVLRADFVVAQMSADRYYAFAGIPEKQGDFLNGLGVDKTVVERLAADTAANLFRSNVTHKPRRVLRLPGPQGSVWLTLDVDGESPDRDPIRNPVDVAGPVGTQRFNFQASEVFFTRANGFWGVALYAANGTRQDSVPDKVAKDTEAQDGIVRPIISCVRCHEMHGEAGLQPFTDDQHPLLTGEAAILKSYLPEVAQRVGELYDPARLKKQQDRDREDYSSAVQAACGCTTKEAALALAGTFARYTFDEVTRDTAAAETGVSVDGFVARTSTSSDPITLALRSGKRVTRKAFEASFQDIILRVTQ